MSCGRLSNKEIMKSATIERFNEGFIPEPNSGCWLWVRSISRNGNGYGFFKLGEERTAHRSSWIIFRGIIPAGKFVLHKCDTPSCVNPDHLFLGSQKDNILDMYKKHREGTSYSGGRTPIEYCKSNHLIMKDFYTYPNGKKECAKCRIKRHKTSNKNWRKYV
jgi:hypothetical protein